MNACEARNITENVFYDAYDKIEKSAREGLDICIINKPEEWLISMLASDGYVVDLQDDDVCVIGW